MPATRALAPLEGDAKRGDALGVTLEPTSSDPGTLRVVFAGSPSSADVLIVLQDALTLQTPQRDHRVRHTESCGMFVQKEWVEAGG